MVKCPGVIGWKANAPIPGMESAGKCPTIARGGMGTAGIAGLMHFNMSR